MEVILDGDEKEMTSFFEKTGAIEIKITEKH